MAIFTNFSNYNGYGYDSVVFGSNAPVLEVELNEMQQIVDNKLRRIIESYGNIIKFDSFWIEFTKIGGKPVINYTGLQVAYDYLMETDNAKNRRGIFIEKIRDVDPTTGDTPVGSVVLEDIEYAEEGETRVPIYLNVNMTTVRDGSVIPMFNGWLDNPQRITVSGLKDERLDIETTRRNVLLYGLSNKGYRDTENSCSIYVGTLHIYENRDGGWLEHADYTVDTNVFNGILPKFKNIDLQLDELNGKSYSENVLPFGDIENICKMQNGQELVKRCWSNEVNGGSSLSSFHLLWSDHKAPQSLFKVEENGIRIQGADYRGSVRRYLYSPIFLSRSLLSTGQGEYCSYILSIHFHNNETGETVHTAVLLDMFGAKDSYYSVPVPEIVLKGDGEERVLKVGFFSLHSSTSSGEANDYYRLQLYFDGELFSGPSSGDYTINFVGLRRINAIQDNPVLGNEFLQKELGIVETVKKAISPFTLCSYFSFSGNASLESTFQIPKCYLDKKFYVTNVYARKIIDMSTGELGDEFFTLRIDYLNIENGDSPSADNLIKFKVTDVSNKVKSLAPCALVFMCSPYFPNKLGNGGATYPI